jgi:hypothetical protein
MYNVIVKRRVLYLFAIGAFLTACISKPEAAKPEPRLPQRDLLATYLDSANQVHKNVFLLFGFEKCGACRHFHNYHRDPEVKKILDKYFLILYVDINHTAGARALFEKYGAEAFPSWAILDASGNMMSGSRRREPGTTNGWQIVGYPVGDSAILYYLETLKRASGKMTDEECRMLSRKLRK